MDYITGFIPRKIEVVKQLEPVKVKGIPFRKVFIGQHFAAGTIFGDMNRFINCVFDEECQLRGWNRLGNECEVGDGARIGDNLTIEYRGVIGNGCTIGDGCVMEDKCVVGRKCVFGENLISGDFCEFGEFTRFGNQCDFGDYCSFKDRCQVGEPLFGRRGMFSWLAITAWKIVSCRVFDQV
jgi:NDP-sugar pyrophosphorylase family protein